MKENNKTEIKETHTLHNVVVTKFDWKDRLRILFGRKFRTRVSILLDRYAMELESKVEYSKVDSIFTEGNSWKKTESLTDLKSI